VLSEVKPIKMGPVQTLRFIRLITGKAPIVPADVERLGLLAVKLGQLLALRSDFFPPERCRELQRLYQSASAVPAQDALPLLHRSAPPRLLTELESFEERPVAAASVGQVHRARLRSGETVAVKLIKSDFAGRFQRDVRQLKWQMQFARGVYPPLRRLGDVTGLIQHIENYTLMELDLRNEMRGAARLMQLRERMARDGGALNWRVPRYHVELSNARVLVSEWIEGPTLENLLAAGRVGLDDLLDLFRIHGTCLFGHGEFHGDLHPGNVILRDGEFIFLDNAAVVRAPRAVRQSLFRFFERLANGRNDEAFHALLGMSPTPPDAPTLARYLANMRELYRDFRGKAVSEVSLTRQMMLTIRQAVETGCVFDEGAFPVIRALMFMDGMVLRAAPQTDLIGAMRPRLAELASLTPDLSDIREPVPCS